MRTLVLFALCYLVHRVLLHVWVPYRATMQRFDQRIPWINALLVAYLAMTFLLRLLQYYFTQGE